MRVLFTTQPGTGTFHPHVPVARALETAGHEVAFAVAKSFCPTIEASGFRSFPAGYDWLMSERQRLVEVVLEQLGGKSFSPLEDMYAGFLAPRMVPDLLAIARSWRPEMIVRDPMEFGGCVAAEVLGIPHATSGPLLAFWRGSWTGPPGEIGKPDFEELRRSYDLPPDPALTMLHRYLYLALVPPAFPHPDLMLPSTVHCLRSVGFNQSGTETLPGWVAELAKQPTVHASLGTVFNRMPGVFAAIIEGLRNEAVNLIVAVGRDQDPAIYGSQPSNVHVERYIPHTLLLPHCDAIITHCGFSSMMACLEHGLPMVAMPLAGDQPANAARCAALGAACLVSPECRTPQNIRDATLKVLHNPQYRQNAVRLKHEMESLPALEHAVELLEMLVATRAPVFRESQQPLEPLSD
jgi:UDP:flavonoid glycosyltransferase YjiC (YdhE family)